MSLPQRYMKGNSTNMKLLTKELENRFAEMGEQDIEDPLVIAKFFNPTGAGTWLATEYNPVDKIFFGYVSIFGEEGMDEWGNFSLEELENFKGTAIIPHHL